MIKIDRTSTPPASLAIESKKAHGCYTSEDVISQLKKDFHSKCYLCELKDLTDIEVEHLLPHYDRKIKERVFDWNNLFYACPHCNSIKNNRMYDEKILDCCRVDPESLLDHIYQEGKVNVRPHDPATQDERVIMTADLLENCFEKRNTSIRVFHPLILLSLFCNRSFSICFVIKRTTNTTANCLFMSGFCLMNLPTSGRYPALIS